MNCELKVQGDYTDQILGTNLLHISSSLFIIFLKLAFNENYLTSDPHMTLQIPYDLPTRQNGGQYHDKAYSF